MLTRAGVYRRRLPAAESGELDHPLRVRNEERILIPGGLCFHRGQAKAAKQKRADDVRH